MRGRSAGSTRSRRRRTCRTTSPASFRRSPGSSVSGHVNGGLRGIVRAETRDDEAANNLRDVVRGFLALAKLQAGRDPSCS